MVDALVYSSGLNQASHRSRMVSSLAKGSLGASYMQVPESGTLVHGTPEASVRGKLGLSSLGRVYMGLKLVGLQAPRMMGVISTESCSTECFDRKPSEWKIIV